jgi:hypothetical protein
MVLCLGWFQNPDKDIRPYPGHMLNITLPDSPGIAVFQDHYGGHCRKKQNKNKTTTHVMMLRKYKPTNQDDAL